MTEPIGARLPPRLTGIMVVVTAIEALVCTVLGTLPLLFISPDDPPKPSRYELLELIPAWIATTVLCFVVLMRDEDSLPPWGLRRAFPPATKLSAVLAFGQLGVAVHFLRTRRRHWLDFSGTMQGAWRAIVWVFVISLPAVAISWIVRILFD